MINIKNKDGHFKSLVPPLGIIHFFIKELPEYGMIKVCSNIVHFSRGLSNTVSTPSSKARPHEVFRHTGFTEECERQSHEHLEPNNNNNAPNQLLGSIGVLHCSQETWENEHDTSLHGQSKCQCHRSHDRLVLNPDKVKRHDQVHAHDLIIEHQLVEFSISLAAEPDESEQLGSKRFSFEVSEGSFAHQDNND